MSARYPWPLIVLHWLMAVMILLMLASGLVIGTLELERAQKFQLMQWHKSLGVWVLIVAMIRLAVRVRLVVPPLPLLLPERERRLARLGHVALYGWMVAVPLAGWLIVSSSATGLPTLVFGWFEWPHVPGVAMNEAVHEVAEEAHFLLAYSLLILVVIHVAAVAKHWWKDRVNLLSRMGLGR